MHNPVTNQLTIRLERAAGMSFEVSIIHTTGKQVYTQTISSASPDVDMQIPTVNFAQGQYIVQIKDKQGLKMDYIKLVKL